ncbi:MAG: peptide deformylase [Solirubrobacterales bacterium]
MSRIIRFGDPLLKSRASEITEFGTELVAEADEMVSLMRDAIGCGLAANQVGRLRRLLVIEPPGEEAPTALVNPEVEWLSEELDEMQEACLSIPGIAVDVARPVAGRFTGLDLAGTEVRLELEGLPARILQHELDHLDGILILYRPRARNIGAGPSRTEPGGSRSPISPAARSASAETLVSSSQAKTSLIRSE